MDVAAISDVTVSSISLHVSLTGISSRRFLFTDWQSVLSIHEISASGPGPAAVVGVGSTVAVGVGSAVAVGACSAGMVGVATGPGAAVGDGSNVAVAVDAAAIVGVGGSVG